MTPNELCGDMLCCFFVFTLDSMATIGVHWAESFPLGFRMGWGISYLAVTCLLLARVSCKLTEKLIYIILITN